MSRASARWFVLPLQVLIVAALAGTSLHPAVAEEAYDPPSRVARLSYLRGPVSFQPAGESEWVEAIANRPLTTGDRLWTDTGARAELSTGSVVIRLDANTDFSFLDLDDRAVQIQLTQGTVTVRVKRLHEDEIVEVDTPNQAFSVLRRGSYRVEASEDGYSTRVTVRAGEGEAYGGGETFTVSAGESTRFTGTETLDAAVFRASPFDELDEWGRQRDRRSQRSRSARYVSNEVVGYEDLDDNGTWSRDPGYGDVWIPTQVASGWAPYRNGHWAWISPWGYTWVDDAPWGYAPFHYGRWVTVGGRWAWVPGPIGVRAVYAPALVAFIGGPSFGVSLSFGGGGPGAEVAWFPLGPREVYVPAYHASRGYVNRVNVSNTTVSITTITNVYNVQATNHYTATNVRYVNRSAPGGVTVVPQQAFTSAQPVARVAMAVNVQRLAAAPIGRTAAAAPTRNSVFGIAASRAMNAPRPPPAVAARSVVAKTPPPPPPVSFARQQGALEARPGQPLARQEVERIRPQEATAPRPLVRLAPPGRRGVAKRAEQAAQPPAPPASGQQAVQQRGRPQSAAPGAQQPQQPPQAAWPGARKPQQPPQAAAPAPQQPQPPPKFAAPGAQQPQPPPQAAAPAAQQPQRTPKFAAPGAQQPQQPPQAAAPAAQQPPVAAPAAQQPQPPPKIAAPGAQQSQRPPKVAAPEKAGPPTPAAGKAPRTKRSEEEKEKDRRDGKRVPAEERE